MKNPSLERRQACIGIDGSQGVVPGHPKQSFFATESKLDFKAGPGYFPRQFRQTVPESHIRIRFFRPDQGLTG